MYNKEPSIEILGREQDAYRGYADIAKVLQKKMKNNRKTVIVIECYPAVRQQEIIVGLKAYLQLLTVIDVEAAALNTVEMNHKVERFLTDDRVFGYMSPLHIEELYDLQKLAMLREQVEAVTEGIVILIGFGASLAYTGDMLVYADLTRWEIQLRYRSKEFGNWLAYNEDEDMLRKYKRGYFYEWRMADRLKRSLFKQIDYYLDTNKQNDPKLVSWEAILDGMEQITRRPFRLVPYFDPGVWGGNWLQEKLSLPPKEHPYAWGFDGVPEENSLYLDFGPIQMEMPAINLVFLQPKALLGERVYARFGAEFPIRFDFLDTIGGQPLSLQVHPTTDYIQTRFGMSYTQDESYYILDAMPDAEVYLGLKEGVVPEQMLEDLRIAERGDSPFPTSKYVNVFSAKKHDHFLIPAGTIHSSGSGCMVLEISATPYIFTFKLWDWDRLGLDGKPRPVHIKHGAEVIQWDRTTAWVEQELIGQVEQVTEGGGWREERTGLHEYEFIETRRFWFSEPVLHVGNGSVQMLNLVEGDEAVVESPDGMFDPFVVHYAETFIIPASIERYVIRPGGTSTGQTLAIIKAFVKG
ncbi:mannose-6-phosphate isomerase [Paenibacillus psychroresistens]|uniref:Mannose-6-phosphate isomerase n=1 Tax=Paenibacillus psychroresistens TaxID=1778678 RepID=A0A6B8RQA9_9BACL|nr:class I mannose-6-phosphate isomerase [Paenibacillus psychroresistens]QGQ97703.1 mannose-6-phosphate isomerase [Paenibacillus psychroresistens]